MRVIFETPPVPAVDTLPDGRTVRGTARLVVRTLEPGEELPLGCPSAQPVSRWRSTSLAGNGSMPVPPVPHLIGPAVATVPRELIEALPDDVRLFVQWELKPGGTT